jgi:hypothetical protein
MPSSLEDGSSKSQLKVEAGENTRRLSRKGFWFLKMEDYYF